MNWKRPNQTVIKTTCLVLAVALFVGSGVSAVAETGGTPVAEPEKSYSVGDSYQKNETVYVNLDPEGKPYDQTVVNWLHSDRPGVTIEDRTTLREIENVKGDEEPQRTGNNLTWNLEGSDLYYRGKTSEKLPIDVQITYKLDGRQMKPSEIAGKSGKLEMNIRFRNNLKRSAIIGGESVTMYVPVTAAVAFTLPDETFQNVECPDGTVESDGNNQAVALLAMPGLEESLNLKGYDLPGFDEIEFKEEFTLTADVSEFEMGPIAVVMTASIPDLDKIDAAGDIDDMRVDLTDLQGAQNDLTAWDPARRTRSLFTDPPHTEGARILVDDIFRFYDSDVAILDLLPKYVTQENIDLYDRVSDDLDDVDIDEFLDSESIDKLVDRLTEKNIGHIRDLLDDYDTIKDLDSDDLTDLLDEMQDLLDDYDNNRQVFETYQVLLKYADSLIDLTSALDDSTLNALSSQMDALMLAMGEMKMATATDGSQYLTPSKLDTAIALAKSGANGLPSDVIMTMSIAARKVGADNLIPYIETLGQSNVTSGISTYSMNRISLSASLEEEPPEEEADDIIDEIEIPDNIESEPDLDDSNDIDTDEVPEEEESSSTTVDTDDEELEDQDIDETEEEEETSTIEADVQEELYDSYYDAGFDPRDLLVQVLEGVKIEVTNKIASDPQTAQFKNLFRNITDLKTSIDKDLGSNAKEKLSDAIDFTEQMIPRLKKMMKAADDLSDDMHYKNGTRDLVRDLKDMIDDLEANQGNINALRDVLDEYDAGQFESLREHWPDLKDDIREARPILDDLREDLKDPELDRSLHNSPETTKTLLEMKDDMFEQREISEILRDSLEPDKVQTATRMFGTFDRLQEKGSVDKYVGQVDDADLLLARKDAIVELSEEYRIYTDATENADTSLKFIMKTDEIEKPEPEEVPEAPVEEKKGLLEWAKGLIGKLKGNE